MHSNALLNSQSECSSVLPAWLSWLCLPLLVGLVALAGLGGIWFAPDQWYAELSKPSWTPPGWLFGPVWSLLYLLMGISLWLAWQAPASTSERRRALLVFAAQWLLNAAWTPVFFGLQAPGLAFALICLLWLLLVWNLFLFHGLRPLAAALLVPYWMWISFALLLNGVIWLMNRWAL